MPGAWLGTSDAWSAPAVGDMAICVTRDGPVLVRRIPAGDWEIYASDDLRVMSVHFNGRGRRRRACLGAVVKVNGEKPQGGMELEGERSTAWLLKAWSSAGLSPLALHANRVRAGCIPSGDRSVHEHQVLCHIFNSMLTVDHLKGCALQIPGLAVRGLRLFEDVQRSAVAAPDDSAASHYAGRSVAQLGVIFAPGLRRRIPALLKGRADFAMGSEKAEEERGLAGSKKLITGDGKGAVPADPK